MTAGSFDHFTRRAMERAGIDRDTAVSLFHDLAKAVKLYDALDSTGHDFVELIRKVEYNRRMFRCNVQGKHMVAIVGANYTPITIMTTQQAKRYRKSARDLQHQARVARRAVKL